jgi:hypothetical protein
MRDLKHLRHLILEGLMDSKRLFNILTQLPESLKILDLRGLCIMQVSSQKPITLPSIRELYLSDDFNENIILPDSLEVFHSGNRFNRCISLPRSLKKLKLGLGFNQKIPDLPELEELEIITEGICIEDLFSKLPKLRKLKLAYRRTREEKYRDMKALIISEGPLEELYIFSEDIIMVSISKLPRLTKLSLLCRVKEVVEIPETVEVLYVLDKKYVKVTRKPQVFRDINFS